MFRITEGKSFSIRLENGVTILVELGRGDYSATKIKSNVNRHMGFSTRLLISCGAFLLSLIKPPITAKCRVFESYAVKVSAWKRGGCYITRFYPKTEADTYDWVQPKELLRFLNWAAKRRWDA